ENYVVTQFIAEFWNSTTNSLFVVLAGLGIWSVIKHQQGKRMLLCYVALMMVGLGSGFFHATLKYTTQLLDELPMLYTCALSFYALVEIDRQVQHGWRLPVGIGALQLAITLIYIFWLQSPAFHQVAFAFTAMGTVGFGYKRMKQMRIDRRTKRLMTRLLVLGHIGMYGGFLVWNLDNIFCHRLRSYRQMVNSPLDVFLQLHGWWHILTAYGSTYLILWVHFARITWLGHDHLFTVKHKFGLFPHVAMRTPKKVE
ncbi:alkaline ceramidase ydc1, partial [Linderina pennispora]